jgi:hypothetical protein
MFESMVDRALSRTQVDYAPKKTAAAAGVEPMSRNDSSYSSSSLPRIRRIQ